MSFLGDCEHQENSYIGMNTTTLSRRLTLHKSSGAIQAHMKSRHNRTVTREELEDNTKILRAETDFIQLQTLEGLHIQEKSSTLNQLATGNQRTLDLHNIRHRQNHTRQVQLPTNHTPDPNTPDAPPPLTQTAWIALFNPAWIVYFSSLLVLALFGRVV